jgi:hypothetical protein
MMKRVLTGVFASVALLLAIASCATVPPEPLGEGELRLLKISVPENGNLRPSLSYTAEISFEADGKPEISRVVCYFAGEGPYYYRIRDVTYGSPGSFTIDFSIPDAGSQRLECYANYVRDGKKLRTNAVFSHVFGISS